MKIRCGFVSNSSSSSFVISRCHLTSHQQRCLEDHIEVARSLGMEAYLGDDWYITVTDTSVRGSTIMDNFDMHEFMDRIGIDLTQVDFNEY